MVCIACNLLYVCPLSLPPPLPPPYSLPIAAGRQAASSMSVPTVWTLVPSSGHQLFLDNPDDFDTLLLRALAALPPAPATLAPAHTPPSSQAGAREREPQPAAPSGPSPAVA
jgi:hypothetical protein